MLNFIDFFLVVHASMNFTSGQGHGGLQLQIAEEHMLHIMVQN